jgi:hypothetical protein
MAKLIKSLSCIVLHLISYEVSHCDFHHIDGDCSWYLGAFDGLGEIHLHGASSLHGIGIFDGDIWWRSFTSLWWMVMVDGLLMVLGGTFMSLLDGSLS